MRLSGFVIHDDSSAVALLSESVGNCTAAMPVSLPAEIFSAWLDSSGDGVTTYRQDLTALAVSYKE